MALQAVTMNDEDLLRYSRHIFLPEIDIAGQERLLAATALVVGLGGLGSAAALYLAASGVGSLILADDERVELSNLQRQILHGTGDVGRFKTDSARDRIAELNPRVQIEMLTRRLDNSESLASPVTNCDVVLDCSDNFSTRDALNCACHTQRKPLVTAAAMGFAAQIAVFFHGGDECPCYRCLFPDHPVPQSTPMDTCSNSGVIAPLVGIVGATQALEAVKIIAQVGISLHGRLLRLDALSMSWKSSSFSRDPVCPVCGDAGVVA